VVDQASDSRAPTERTCRAFLIVLATTKEIFLRHAAGSLADL